MARLPAQVEKPRLSADALELMRQICDGMGHIHRRGLVHGDLKPSNVMMWFGLSPQITDFGLARAAGERDPGALGGTERYFAPEARSGLVSMSTDIYAAGVTFLEMLEPFGPQDFGVSDGRLLALTMIREDPIARPATFDEVHIRLTEILEAAPLSASRDIPIICSSLNRLFFMFYSFLSRTPAMSRPPFGGQAKTIL